jgi:hypothetical protein
MFTDQPIHIEKFRSTIRSMASFDPFPSSREQLSKNISDLELEVQEWRQLRSTNSSSTSWNRGIIQNHYDEAMQLKSVLEGTCRRVALDPSRFNVSPEELASRPAFIEQAGTRLKNISIQLSAPADEPTASKATAPQDRRKAAGREDNQRFIDSEMGQQQEMIERQDVDLDEVVTITARTKTVATVIGDELKDSTARLEEIDVKMDRVQTQLDTVIARMRDFLKKGSTWLWVGCIILTVIAIVLLVWVIVK